jgi:hypothetical protein
LKIRSVTLRRLLRYVTSSRGGVPNSLRRRPAVVQNGGASSATSRTPAHSYEYPKVRRFLFIYCSVSDAVGTSGYIASNGGIRMNKPIYLSMSVYQSVYLTFLSTNLSIYPSIYLSSYLSVYLSACLCIYLSIQPASYLSICLSLSVSICLSIYLSVSLHLPIYLSIYRSICISAYLSVYLSIHPSIYLHLSVYLSMYPSVYLSTYLIYLWLNIPLLDLGRFFSFLILCTVGIKGGT